jgi:hypothetical protein
MECALCTEICTFYGLTECGHKSVCSLCWYRLRSTLKSNSCPVCRHDCTFLFIVSDFQLTYESVFKTMWGDSFPGYIHDEMSNVHFKDHSELLRLQNFRKILCKVCAQEFKQLKQLKDHLSTFHALKVCDLCVHSNKLFISEQELYEEEGHKLHKITQHAQCDLCYDYCYDQRELLAHIKSSHFFCELCVIEKRTAFNSYPDLEAHYRKAHYLCEVQICREITGVVFLCYDDLKDHYRSEHPTLAIPNPVLGFKTADADDDSEFREEIVTKNYKPPKIDETNKDLEFPALAPAPVETKTIDYSKLKKKKPNLTENNFPRIPAKEPFEFKSEKKDKKNKNNPKKEISELEKNILRINNSHLTVEEFAEWVVNQNICVDSALILTLRNKILSNSNREKIIALLQTPRPMPKKSPKPEEEEKKTIAKPASTKKLKPQGFSPESFPALGPERKIVPKTTVQTLIENITILNNGLIDNKCFVQSLLEFVPRDEINSMKQIIRQKVKPEKVNEVINLLEYNLVITSNDKEYPSLSQTNTFTQKSFLDNLRLNIKHLNSGMMTTKEFLSTYLASLEPHHAQEAIKIVKDAIFSSSTSSQIIKAIQEKSGILCQEDFPRLKLINLPSEPKKNSKKNKK